MADSTVAIAPKARKFGKYGPQRGPNKIPAEQKFWMRVDRRGPDECWPWLGGKCKSGYGMMRKSYFGIVVAHRIAYTLCVGPVADDLELDHLCRNRGCVNPAHLEPVPPKVNNHRGVGAAARNAKKTHCPKGHPLSGENLMVLKQGFRRCKTCMDAQRRKSRQKSRLASQ